MMIIRILKAVIIPLCSATLWDISAFAQGENDTVTLKNNFISATFKKSSNFTLSDLSVGKESFINTISPTFHYQGTNEYQEYYSSVANISEFGDISDKNDRHFRFINKTKNDNTFTVFTEDKYIKIEQEANLSEDMPVLELKYKFTVKEKVLLKFWTFLPSVHFSSTSFKWICPSLKIKNGIVVLEPTEKMSEDFSRKYQNLQLSENVNSWFAAKSLSRNDGIIFLMPNDRGRFFIQNQKAYLAISSSFNDDILLQKGQTGEVKFYIVCFNGDVESSLKYWYSKFNIPHVAFPRPPVSPTGRLLSKTDDFIIWSDIPDRDILKEESAPMEKTSEIRVATAKNETGAFQLVIQGGKDMNCLRMEGVTLRFTPFKQENPKIEIPAENISFQVEEYIKLLHGREGENPDMLVNQRTFYVSPGENRVLFIKVRTQENTPAGNYSGKIELYQGKTNLADIPLNVKVYDFVVPHSKHLGLWLVPSLKSSLNRIYPPQEANRLYPKYMDNIIKHRATIQNAIINVFFKPEFAIPEGMDFDLFKKQLGECINLLGMKMVNCRIFGIGASARLKKTPYGGTEDIFSPLWTERYRKTAERMRDFLRENNWQNKVCFELFDEPKTRDIDNIRKAGKILKDVFPEIKLTYWGPPDERLSGVVNIWVTAWKLSHSPRFTNERRNAGEQIWYYNPPYGAIDEGEYMRYVFWSAWNNNLDGVYMWQTSNWFDWDKLTKGRERNNGASWFYPGDNGPTDTLRWERMREGLEDYEYFYMLKKAIANAQKQKLSEDEKDAVDNGENALAEISALFETGRMDIKAYSDHILMHEIRGKIMQALEKLYKFVPEEDRK